MAGYRWDPVVRVVPSNGPETVYWFSDRLTDLGAHTKIVLRYAEVMKNTEDVNRSLRPVVFGVRPEVEITCTIMSMADQLFLAEIESALLQPLDHTVFLSLDGGVVERQVVISVGSVAEPLRGKVYLGATFKLAMRCVDLIPARPAMMTDPNTGTELVPNNGLEAWIGSVADGWLTSGVYTTTKELTVVKTGAAAARTTRSDGASFGSFHGVLPVGPKIGCWYRVRISARGDIDMAVVSGGPVRLRIHNVTRATQIPYGGGIDEAAGTDTYPNTAVLAASWTDIETYIRVPLTWKTTDQVWFELAGYFTSTPGTPHYVYYDDASLYGPVLRPGVATW